MPFAALSNGSLAVIAAFEPGILLVDRCCYRDIMAIVGDIMGCDGPVSVQNYLAGLALRRKPRKLKDAPLSIRSQLCFTEMAVMDSPSTFQYAVAQTQEMVYRVVKWNWRMIEFAKPEFLSIEFVTDLVEEWPDVITVMPERFSAS